MPLAIAADIFKNVTAAPIVLNNTPQINPDILIRKTNHSPIDMLDIATVKSQNHGWYRKFEKKNKSNK
jgi:hypothetical protein